MKAKNRGLGRGLNALFEDEEVMTAPVSAGGEVAGGTAAPGASSAGAPAGDSPGGAGNTRRQVIDVDLMQPGKFQPRTLFHEDSLTELAQSIKTHGLLQPIVVRTMKEMPGFFEIIAGERRWRAAQKAQLHEVPAIVMDLTDEQALEIALVENLQREDLNPVDEAMGYKKLMDQFSHTQEELAEALGKSRSHIANMVRLLSLPDVVLAYLERGELSMGHARALITAGKPEALAKEVVARNLSVRETERLVAQSDGRKSKSKSSFKEPQEKDVNILMLEKDIGNALGMRVQIESSDSISGQLVIHYKTLDQLDEVIKKLVFAKAPSF